MQKYLIFFTLILVPLLCFGQSNFPSGDKDEYYYRILQISGITGDNASYNLRPIVFSETISESHPWQEIITGKSDPLFSPARFVEFDLYEPVWFQSYNTTLPRGTNDGAVWQGKGYNTAFSMGAGFSAGPLRVRFRPLVGMAQNREFDLGPHQPGPRNVYGVRSEFSEFSYPYSRGIDYVQRFGNSTYSWFDLGDSSAELRYSGFRLALSNQRVWTGPGVNTALHFGYSGPGFRHAYAGTYRPVETPAGSFEFAYIFGQTKESDYFTTNRVIESQSVNSLIFIYSPWFTDHFSIGVIRTFFHRFPDDFTEFRNQARKLFEPGLKDAVDEVDARGTFPDNQVASMFFRYFIPEHGFEFYAEYGRNDHNADWRDFRAQPNHYRAYTLGFIRSIVLPKQRLLALNFEINQLEVMRTALTRGGRALAGWYTHDKQILGITNNGQVLGTGYGPGLNMQKLHAVIFDSKGSLAFKAARITYDNSRLDNRFSVFQNANSESVERNEIRNIELMAGIETTAFLRHGLELSAVIEQSYIMNQHHLKGNDLMNTRLEIVVRKQISGWRR